MFLRCMPTPNTMVDPKGGGEHRFTAHSVNLGKAGLEMTFGLFRLSMVGKPWSRGSANLTCCKPPGEKTADWGAPLAP